MFNQCFIVITYWCTILICIWYLSLILVPSRMSNLWFWFAASNTILCGSGTNVPQALFLFLSSRFYQLCNWSDWKKPFSFDCLQLYGVTTAILAAQALYYGKIYPRIKSNKRRQEVWTCDLLYKCIPLYIIAFLTLMSVWTILYKILSLF